MRMTDLAASLKITRSRLNYAVTRLDRDDWVRREQSGADRRGQFAVLTAEGMAALERAVPGHVATVRAMVFDRLSPEQVTEELPDLEPADVQACLRFASRRVADPEPGSLLGMAAT